MMVTHLLFVASFIVIVSCKFSHCGFGITRIKTPINIIPARTDSHSVKIHYAYVSRTILMRFRYRSKYPSAMKVFRIAWSILETVLEKKKHLSLYCSRSAGGRII